MKRRGSEELEVGLSLIEFGEEAFFGLELAGVDAATAGGVLEVEHLVVEKVLDGAAGGVGAVEDAADDDGVVGGVVVAKHSAGGVGGPGEGGATEESVEETGVEGLEDFVQVVVVAGRGGDALASAGLADLLGEAGYGLRADVAAVAVSMDGGDGLLVELGEEDVGDGVVDGLGCVLEEVRETDVEAAFTQADGGVEGGEAAEADFERRDRRAGAEVAVLLLEDGDQGGVHC
jgi:hypothetical protein